MCEEVTGRILSGDGDQEYTQAKGTIDARNLLQRKRMILLVPSSPPIEWMYQIRSKEYAKFGVEWKLTGDAPTPGYEDYREAFNKVMSDMIISKYGRDFFENTEKRIELKTNLESHRRDELGIR
jgi:hypothetical protein